MKGKEIRIWALFVFLTLVGGADDEARDAAWLYEDDVNVCHRGGNAEDCRARMSDSLRLDPSQACLSALKPSEPAASKASRVLLPVPRRDRESFVVYARTSRSGFRAPNVRARLPQPRKVRQRRRGQHSPPSASPPHPL